MLALQRRMMRQSNMEVRMRRIAFGVLLAAGLTLGCGGISEEGLAADAMDTQEGALAPSCQPGETSRTFVLCGACGPFKGNYTELRCRKADGTWYLAGIIAQDCNICL
ncbi:hypothetical protein LY474_19515 [Myxococcus stipitatus]|uniref:hypothetical protein n=1 Tax=Myxococcus stipitatus TaxID=83455 RepID=UPI001F21B229|nr:hypothetical protein [Myxococcus stipitatus]MCE9669992.1 hypothetical protein [Myxococcus stipitatus]